MPKNKIQFQRGLSLPEFLAKYGSNNQCRAALVKFRWPNGFACPSCGNDTYYEIGTRILFQCKACRRQVPVIISETIFHQPTYRYLFGFSAFIKLPSPRTVFLRSTWPAPLEFLQMPP